MNLETGEAMEAVETIKAIIAMETMESVSVASVAVAAAPAFSTVSSRGFYSQTLVSVRLLTTPKFTEGSKDRKKMKTAEEGDFINKQFLLLNSFQHLFFGSTKSYKFSKRNNSEQTVRSPTYV